MAKLNPRERRKMRIRNKISGSAERPRLSVYRSASHIYAQVIDDASGATLAAASTLSKDLSDKIDGDNKSSKAKKVGELVAKLCLAKNIKTVVFDRNGYLYHGRIKALADGAREGGLDF